MESRDLFVAYCWRIANSYFGGKQKGRNVPTDNKAFIKWPPFLRLLLWYILQKGDRISNPHKHSPIDVWNTPVTRHHRALDLFHGNRRCFASLRRFEEMQLYYPSGDREPLVSPIQCPTSSSSLPEMHILLRTRTKGCTDPYYCFHTQELVSTLVFVFTRGHESSITFTFIAIPSMATA